MGIVKRIGALIGRAGYLVRAAAWAVVLGIIETVGSERGRRVLAVVALAGLTIAFVLSRPIRSIAPGEVGIRTNRLTGGVAQLGEGWAWALPGIHELRRYPLRDQVYRPEGSARADGATAFQSLEGLSIGVEVTVRYALDPDAVATVALGLPTDVGRQLVEPMVDGVLHRTFARHTVREIFSSKRADIEQSISADLGKVLAGDGVIVRGVFLGNVDLPPEYKAGLEAVLAEELEAEKMRYTLELRNQQIVESELQAKADKVRRETAAEAAGQEEIIAARARAEAMKHVLPLKEKQIEQQRLEAQAAKVSRLTQAEGEAEARRIEAGGEADSRRTLADADAYRLEVTGKAASDQLARDSELLAKNPLLIQKTLADKLSDKIQVIVAPPEAGGFFAGGLLAIGRPAAVSGEE